MARDLDPYVTLELPPDATDDEVDDARRRKLLRTRDPDRHARINTAYDSIVADRSGAGLLASLVTKAEGGDISIPNELRKFGPDAYPDHPGDDDWENAEAGDPDDDDGNDIWRPGQAFANEAEWQEKILRIDSLDFKNTLQSLRNRRLIGLLYLAGQDFLKKSNLTREEFCEGKLFMKYPRVNDCVKLATNWSSYLADHIWYVNVGMAAGYTLRHHQGLQYAQEVQSLRRKWEAGITPEMIRLEAAEKKVADQKKAADKKAAEKEAAEKKRRDSKSAINADDANAEGEDTPGDEWLPVADNPAPDDRLIRRAKTWKAVAKMERDRRIKAEARLRQAEMLISDR